MRIFSVETAGAGEDVRCFMFLKDIDNIVAMLTDDTSVNSFDQQMVSVV